MVQFLAATAIIVISALVGQAVLVAAGERRWSWLSPAVGFAVLLVIVTAAIKLPGGATTAAISVAVATAASALVVFPRVPTRPSWMLAVIPAAAVVAALPFLAKGHVGLLGMSLNDDPAFHLVWAEGLRSKAMASLYPPDALYPLAPHALLATFAGGLSIDVAQTFTGLLIAVPIMTALAAIHGLRGAPGPLRIAGALVVAFAYVAAAYYGQAAFKEGVLTLFLLAFALQLGRLGPPQGLASVRGVLPLAALLSGALLTYSYFALAWFGVTAAGFVVLLIVVHRPPRGTWPGAARGVLLFVLAGGALVVAAVAVDLRRIVQFYDNIGASPAVGGGGIPKANTGNLLENAVPVREVLGIWPNADFRAPAPPDTFLLGPLSWLALAALLYGVAWHLRRRELGVVAALGACVVVYAIAHARESDYVVAKTLAVMAPLVMIVMARPLLVRESPPGAGTQWAGFKLGIALVLGLAVGLSSVTVLRAAPVESPAQRDQLAELRPLLHGRPTLFLPTDDFAQWRLRGVPLGFFGGVLLTPPVPVAPNPAKPWHPGEPADFDSVTARGLDRFDYAITARAAYTSAAPANFRPVHATQLYQLWRRSGPTSRRETVEPSPAPVGTLTCAPGIAGVARRWSSPPVVMPGPYLASGKSATIPLTLPPGTWDISLQYLGEIPIRVQVGGRHIATVPANTAPPGTYWPGFRLRSSGAPIELIMIGERQSRLTSPHDFVWVLNLAATPVPLGRNVAARRACGKPTDYVVPRARAR